MDLFEYQARDMFEKHGVPVLAGIVATTPAEARPLPRAWAAAPSSSRPRSRPEVAARRAASRWCTTRPTPRRPPRRFSAWTSRATRCTAS